MLPRKQHGIRAMRCGNVDGKCPVPQEPHAQQRYLMGRASIGRARVHLAQRDGMPVCWSRRMTTTEALNEVTCGNCLVQIAGRWW